MEVGVVESGKGLWLACRLQVNQGKDAMPPFNGVLSEEEIAAVASFVYDQASGDKW